MYRPPPRSTPPDTLFPYATLLRSPSLPLMPRRKARKKKSLAINGRTDAVAHPLAVDLSKADRTHGVRHVAIIMDGNGRWAKKRLLPRFAGHKAGVEAVRRTARAAREMGLEVLTLYAFSSENWKRPESEVGDLMGLLRHFIQADLAEFEANDVRLDRKSTRR